MSQSRFGKFAIIGQLGSGGMAEVFKCRLSGIGGFDKIVVVKRILPSLASDDDFVRMFLDEARTAANLTHPNIVQVFEIDQIDGQPYMAMEYVDGVTLARLHRYARREGNVHLGHMANIVAEICEGLHYAHSAIGHDGHPLGLVHRDVSPQNIMISREGVPKLLDFGVAKANGRLVHTRAGTLKGKVRYMAPEQVRDSEVELDHRADVFSLGVCLYEATTGHLPFGRKEDSEITLLKNLLKGEFRKPSDFVPDYPPILEAAVLWAIQPDLDKRCPSARELHDALKSFVGATAYHSNGRAVAAWMAAMKPIEDEKSKAGTPLFNHVGVSTVAPGKLKTQLIQNNTPRKSVAELASVEVEMDSMAGQEHKRRRIWMVGAAAAALLVLAGMIWLLLPAPREVEVAQPIPSPSGGVAPAPPVSASPNDAAQAFLAEAERFAAQKRFRPAMEMLTKAKEIGPTDPALTIKITRMADEIDRKALLAKATTALRNDQYAAAIEAAKLVLDNDPENPEATALIARARSEREARAAPPVVVASRAPAPAPRKAVERPAPREGRLNVQSTPSGMVYIDDVPVGRTPLNGMLLTAGWHSVQVRLQGYAPAASDVNVVAGKETAMVFPLALLTTPRRVVAEDLPDNPPSTASGGSSASASTPPPAPPPATSVASSASSEPRGVSSLSQTSPPPPQPMPGAVPSSGGAVATERKRVLPPSLPKTYTASDKADIARVLGLVEQEAISKGVPRDFAHRVTYRLFDRLQQKTGDVDLYPSATYYLIVREAALGHDRSLAADNVRNSYFDGSIVRFRDLPQKTVNLR